MYVEHMIDPEDTATKPLPQSTRLCFASGERIYIAILTPDLFEQWMVMQLWDGKGNLQGGRKTSHVDSLKAGLAMLNGIKKMREKRGDKQYDDHAGLVRLIRYWQQRSCGAG